MPVKSTRAERSDGSTIEHRMRIQGYVSRDGVVHAWPGTVEPAGPDSLRLVLPREPEQGIVGGGHAGHVLVVARDEVWTVRRVSAAAPLMFMLLAVSAMVLIAYATSPPLTFFGN